MEYALSSELGRNEINRWPFRKYYYYFYILILFCNYFYYFKCEKYIKYINTICWFILWFSSLCYYS